LTSPIDADRVASPTLKVDGHRTHAHFEHLRRRLRWRLLIAYATPLLVLGLYFYFHYRATLREGIDNHLKSVAENRRNTVDLFLAERVNNVRNAFRGDPSGETPTALEMQLTLDELRRESPTFVDLGLFAPDGVLVAYAGPHPSLLGKNYGEEAWFKTLHSQERDYYLSDVYLGFRGKPHFVVAVKRTVGGRQWTVRASVDPQKFGEFVARSYLIEEMEAFIINRDGQRQTLFGMVDEDSAASVVPPRTAETMVDEVQVGGVRYLRAVAWLTGNDWALVVRMPADRAYAPMHRAGGVLLGIVGLALGFILLVVLRSTRRLVARLEETDKARQDLALHLFDAAKLASLGEMAAGVAHEINNPLAIVYEEASMVEDILDPQFGQQLDLDDLRERLAAIKEATIRGRNITGKLLAFSRHHEPDPEPSDINLLVDRVLAVKELDFKVSNIDVTRELDADLPWAMINRNQMDQVLLNLLNNAKDAIHGPGRISIRTRFDGGWVRLDVTDTGCGMTREVLEQVFYPFFTTKGVGKGTGLGLSISYGIVKSFGGRIEVESEVGHGTTFSVFLPIEPRGARERSGNHVNDARRGTNV